MISDILPTADLAGLGQPQKVVALATTLLVPDDDTNNAIYDMVRATTVEQFRDATRRFHAPQQNLMVADTKGSIGYIAAGHVPVRKNKTCDGLLPADGATGTCDWTGWAAFDRIPRIFGMRFFVCPLA